MLNQKTVFRGLMLCFGGFLLMSVCCRVAGSTDLINIGRVMPISTYLNISGLMFVSDSRVGIGISSPLEELDVAGDIKYTGALKIFNGATQVGEITTTDTTWLRINQNVAKNIYTPRYIRADEGLYVDGTAYGIDGSGILKSNTGATIGGNTAWHAGNDGSGSGLDADLLDGQHGYYFSKAASSQNSIYSADTRSINYNASDRNAGLYADFKYNSADGLNDGGTYHGVLTFRSYGAASDLSGGYPIQIAYTANGNLWTRMATSASTWDSWEKQWGEGNDGSGSGLDADLLDGQHGSYYYPASNPYGFYNSTSIPSVPDSWVNATGDSMSGQLTMSGTSANIALGSNYLSGDGGDEGVFVASDGDVGIGTNSPSQRLSVSGSIFLTGDIYGGRSGESGIWRFSTTYPNYGIIYTDSSPDYISFSPGGGGTSTPDFKVSGSGDVIVKDDVWATDYCNEAGSVCRDIETINTENFGILGSNIDWNTLTDPGAYGISLTSFSNATNDPNATFSGIYPYGVLIIEEGHNGYGITQTYCPHTGSSSSYCVRRTGWGNANGWQSWVKLWDSNSDGSGSGLDADLLDGHDTSYFMTASTDNWVNVAGDTMTGQLTMSGTAANIALGSNYLSGDGGDEGVFVNGSGNVGIGTNSPADTLDVNGDMRVRGGDIKDSGGSNRITFSGTNVIVTVG